jgi:hypothetical protein
VRTIHKYEISSVGRFSLPLPTSFSPLKVATQGGKAFLWVELDTSDPIKVVDFIVFGTGWDLSANVVDGEWAYHVGTFLEGPWVWHLYEIIKERDFDAQTDEEDGEQQIA